MAVPDLPSAAVAAQYESRVSTVSTAASPSDCQKKARTCVPEHSPVASPAAPTPAIANAGVLHTTAAAAAAFSRAPLHTNFPASNVMHYNGSTSTVASSSGSGTDRSALHSGSNNQACTQAGALSTTNIPPFSRAPLHTTFPASNVMHYNGSASTVANSSGSGTDRSALHSGSNSLECTQGPTYVRTQVMCLFGL